MLLFYLSARKYMLIQYYIKENTNGEDDLRVSEPALMRV